jgi:hypothetical protein
VGDLAMAKIEAKPLQPTKGDGQKDSEKLPEKRSKPKTLDEARARQSGGTAGQKMSQEGGVPRPGRISLDAEEI